MKRIGIFCEGNRHVGFGHIRRCMTLLEKLQEESFEAEICGLSEEADELIGEKHKDNEVYDLTIIDSPLNIDNLIRERRLQGNQIITLDYFGSENPDVNIVIYEHSEISGAEKHVGFKFQMLRKEITNLRSSWSGKGVLVTIGGGDLLGEGCKAAEKVERMGEQATLVRGPLCTQEYAKGSYRVVVNPSDFEKRLLASSWVITNGGGSMFEAMYLGKAAVILPQTTEERVIAEEFLRQGAILGIGLNSVREYKAEQIRATSAKATNCIDGLGVARILSIIKKHL